MLQHRETSNEDKRPEDVKEEGISKLEFDKQRKNMDQAHSKKKCRLR